MTNILSNRDKEIIQRLAEIFVNIPDYKKEYLLGIGEGMALVLAEKRTEIIRQTVMEVKK